MAGSHFATCRAPIYNMNVFPPPQRVVPVHRRILAPNQYMPLKPH